ncbi:hypothetical protein [Neobacillus rhizophilus]|uniref:Uncharacterized protein n=1 Tax=Neobacillus rhizophilus TaxID=2833579 RepID=A0A942U5A5_9BACI|nr:hypothetical protein [Neobacillus rhizophilus]MBS4213545.1 hypothetical protein [Neobacillus rhizophilus]
MGTVLVLQFEAQEPSLCFETFILGGQSNLVKEWWCDEKIHFSAYTSGFLYSNGVGDGNETNRKFGSIH